MKILVVSDVEAKAFYDFYTPGKLKEFDLILSCGDLKRQYLEFLVTMARCPLLYVHGNHDDSFEERPPEGCVCIDDDLVVYQGIRILGLGGSYRYRPGAYTFTERQMRLRIRKLWFKLWRRKGFDILLTHAPLRGHNDMDNLSHRGFACFGPLLDKYQPKFFIHGHIHMSYGHTVPRLSRHGDTTVVNAYEYYKLELEPNGAEVRPAGV